MPGEAAGSLTSEEFGNLMAPLAPFESKPHLAIAVSGGADSMALALLASDWAKARSGETTALIVDHRLRPGSTGEAEETARRLNGIGITAVILTREGPTPQGDIQAFARTARYALMTEWCRARGVLHLLTAHHQNDQAETVLLRLARGSGLLGLAAMPAIAISDACRLLRPLLTIPAERLRATMVAFGQKWVEDPSNENAAFARVRMRHAAPLLSELGLDPARLSTTATHLGRARDSLERQMHGLLAETVMIHPAGFAMVDPAPIARATPETALRGLAAIVTCIGGQEFAPRFERLENLYRDVLGGGPKSGRTLSGCRIVRTRGKLLILRELASIAPPQCLDEAAIHWDNRYRISGVSESDRGGITVGALGIADSGRFKAEIAGRRHSIPNRVLPTLPTLRRQGTILSVPHLGVLRTATAAETGILEGIIQFRPKRPLTDCGFTVV